MNTSRRRRDPSAPQPKSAMNPSSFPSAELRLIAKRELDALSEEIDMNEIMKRTEIEEMLRKTAVLNLNNARLRSKLGQMVWHYDDLMAELNRRADYQDKFEYLEGQLQIQRDTRLILLEVAPLQEEETKLTDRLHNNRQLLVAVNESTDRLKSMLTKLNGARKVKSKSRHAATAIHATIVAVAAFITALNWRS